MTKKRFWVFGYDQYYPIGGMNDFRADFDTIEEADAFIRTSLSNYRSWDYIDIYDALNDITIER